MSASVEDRLRRHYDERTRGLPTQGPGLDRGVVLRIAPEPNGQPPNRAARALLVFGAVAAACIAFVVLATRDDDGASPTEGFGGTLSSAPTADEPANALDPAVSLPDADDLSETPATVEGVTPTEWYRLQVDLDVAWYVEPSGTSMVCWRTPVVSDCQPDTGVDGLPPLATGGGQTLVVLSGGTTTGVLDVQLSGGGVLSAPIVWDNTIGWGVARFEVPVDQTITFVGSATAAAIDQDPIAGEPLPSVVGLADVPVTVPVDAQLSFWRWLPDLDIAERETADGGTELCWRTPAGEGCVDDTFLSPSVGIIPTDGAAIVLARPALIEVSPPPAANSSEPRFQLGPLPTTVTATLSDGTTVSADLVYGDEFGVGYARIALAEGLTITDARSQ